MDPAPARYYICIITASGRFYLLAIQFKDLFRAVHRHRLPGEVNLQAQPASLTAFDHNHHSPVPIPGHLLHGIIDTADLLAAQHAFKSITKKRLCQSIPLRFDLLSLVP